MGIRVRKKLAPGESPGAFFALPEAEVTASSERLVGRNHFTSLGVITTYTGACFRSGISWVRPNFTTAV